MQFLALQCVNPECAFRLTVRSDTPLLDHCPRCGSSMRQVALSESSQQIPPLSDADRLPQVVAVLDNLRSALNVGAIFRSGEGAGFSGMILCGITPTPANPKVVKTALGAEQMVPWQHDWDIFKTIDRLKAEGYQLWALEGGDAAVNLFQQVRALTARDKIALIVGSEVHGVDPEVVRLCDRAVYLPMCGAKESLNVATAFGIAAYLIRFGNTMQ